MCEMLLSNQQLIEGSPALQEVSTLCDGLERDEYGVVIDRVNKRVAVGGGQAGGVSPRSDDVERCRYDHPLSPVAAAAGADHELSLDVPERHGSLPDIHTHQHEAHQAGAGEDSPERRSGFVSPLFPSTSTATT